jgi:uncharacterized phiE125 gp8 family phage protein
MLNRGLLQSTPPGGEPITLTEAKLWLRVTNTKEDALIGALISAARASVESFTGLQVNTAVWEVTYDHFPTVGGSPGAGSYVTERWGTFELPKNPVISVDDISYIDDTNVVTMLPTADYIVDTRSKPSRITPAHSKFWPATLPVINSVTITMTCGYGAFDDSPNPVPAGLMQAMHLLILDMYVHREAQSDVLLRENRLINNLLYEFMIPDLADIT